ncbi:MAG: cation-transporting P-type ATPase [Gaiellaceae bacterium]|nr:cation-transporting P-type ATPase [Gaiellaceae bacterium]
MATTAAAAGLTQQEAERKLAARPPANEASSRSYKSIVVANVFTVFNLILLAAGVLTLSFGDAQDAIFLAILVANAGIGIAQEVRAKRTLDRLAALVAPTASVLRDGKPRQVGVEEVVEGDIVLLDAGDQVVADGTLRRSDGLALDESILTGESEPVSKGVGEEVQSGSFAVEGAGAYLVTAVGEKSHAARVAGQAREFRHPRSPLERSINRLLFVLVGVLIPLGVALGWVLYRRHTSLHNAVPTTVAAVVTLVPEGLILLTSVTFAVAGVRMARRGALAQQLNAIESLASVDTICLDKTGTLTDAHLQVETLIPSTGVEEGELAHELGRYAASARSRNATLEAIAEYCAGAEEEPSSSVPFSSKRRWSAQQFGKTTYVLGAPELFPPGELQTIAGHQARAGRRVVAFGVARGPVDADELPAIDEPLGLVVLGERLRADAQETVQFLQSQGVRVFVISGDRPETVAAVAADVGIEGPALDGRDLPRDSAGLRRLLEEHAVIGRISPEDKRRVVEALAADGRYVAMVGDGVNDVPALKAARLAIAPGNGSQMARAVADLVLVRGDFASVPALVAEGRKVLRNLQRVAKLFVTKSAFAFFLVVSIGLTPQPYPLLPRHLTLAAGLTIGIPAFFLALGPSEGRFRSERFLFEVGRFAVPAGTAAGLGVLASFVFARNVGRLPLEEARTIATTVLVLVGLYLILALEATSRRRAAAVGTLTGAMLLLYAIVLAAPGTRHFFALTIPGPGGIFLALAGAALAVGGLWLTDDRFVPGALRAWRDTPSS